jgi:hypothetical protein
MPALALGCPRARRPWSLGFSRRSHPDDGLRRAGAYLPHASPRWPPVDADRQGSPRGCWHRCIRRDACGSMGRAFGRLLARSAVVDLLRDVVGAGARGPLPADRERSP